MSSAIAGLPRPPQTHAFGQLFGCDGEPRFVSAWVCEQSQPVEETQGLEHSSVDANADGVVTRLDAPKRRAAGKGSFSDYLGWQASTAAGVTDIKPELAEGSPYGK
jgi:hypothetical protein